MAPQRTEDGVLLTMKINGSAGQRLRDLAQEQGVPPSRVAREILEEILPRVESVQRGVAIKFRQDEKR